MVPFAATLTTAALSTAPPPNNNKNNKNKHTKMMCCRKIKRVKKIKMCRWQGQAVLLSRQIFVISNFHVRTLQEGVSLLKTMARSSYWRASGYTKSVNSVVAGMSSRSAMVEFIKTRAEEWISANSADLMPDVARSAVRDLIATIDELAQGMACGVKDKNEFEDTVNGIWKSTFQTLREPMDINQNVLEDVLFISKCAARLAVPLEGSRDEIYNALVMNDKADQQLQEFRATTAEQSFVESVCRYLNIVEATDYDDKTREAIMEAILTGKSHREIKNIGYETVMIERAEMEKALMAAWMERKAEEKKREHEETCGRDRSLWRQ